MSNPYTMQNTGKQLLKHHPGLPTNLKSLRCRPLIHLLYTPNNHLHTLPLEQFDHSESSWGFSRSGSSSRIGCACTNTSRFPVSRVVVVLANRLNEVERAGRVRRERLGSGLDLRPSYNGTNKQSQEDNEHDEIQNCITPDTSLAELGLFHRVDGRAYLTTRTEPEQHHRVSLVDVGDGNNRKHEE